MSKELIRLSDCFMKFDDDVILDHINLYINDKEFLTLLGPSGCGKTTTLRIIGGFQKPTSGDVFFDGVRINDVPPHKRAVNTVFQKYALFPHLNVYDNIAKHAGAGTLVPITGFANSIVSPAIEFKSEGLVLGMAAKMFIIAGPVLVYGISTSIVYGLVMFVLSLF